MSFLTDFGDLAILLPLAAAILVWLLAMRAYQAALWWLAALVLCGGVIGLIKIYFVACGSAGQLQSPSGHSGLSALVYGVLAALLATRVEGWRRVTALALSALLVAGIAVSRSVLGAHTPPDVVAGLLIGLVALAVFLVGSAGKLAPAASTRPLWLAAIAVMAILHGDKLHAEAMLHTVGVYLTSGAVCG
jgi:membrane-associated phospholipid phosphatase